VKVPGNKILGKKLVDWAFNKGQDVWETINGARTAKDGHSGKVLSNDC